MINNSNKIKTYHIGRSGLVTKIVALPTIWLKDNNLTHGQTLDMHRLNIDGKDCLVIVKKGDKK